MSKDAPDGRGAAASAEQFVTLCAWSKTVRYEGEWLTFENYLLRRFGLMTTHGISPEALEKLEAEDARAEDASMTQSG